MEKIETIDEILNDILRDRLLRSGRWELDADDIEQEKRRFLRVLVDQYFTARGV